MILSAWYGLLRLDDRIMRYDMRLGHRDAITADGLRDQAEQLGVLTTPHVTVLAPAAYAADRCGKPPSIGPSFVSRDDDATLWSWSPAARVTALSHRVANMALEARSHGAYVRLRRSGQRSCA
jgi:hypothetical protein